ncbi:unnamed protein product [Vicia faba]|uniref:MSP domain-containing protein n=1 Tax=Vicia faba TaxID=3906 RepID=A0AAV0ZSM3_VICFA|nr:unnamed protein product [Vicia faba]
MGQTVSSASSSASKLLRLVIPRRYASPLNLGYEKLNDQDDNLHLQIHPQELQFPFELKKQISCHLQLSNKSNNCVAFKAKTTNQKNYCVKPNIGVVLPKSTINVRVTMQAQKEAPPDMQCRDKFLFQSIVAKHKTYHSKNEATTKDITPKMFDKDSGYVVKECKLRVVYVDPPRPQSPIRDGSDNDSKVSNKHVKQLDTSFEVHPQELQFSFELRKQISSSLELSNKSDNYVAFKVKTTNPKKYFVKPNHGVMLPMSTCDVKVTMEAQKEIPPDMQCKDKFLIQGVVAKIGATTKDITSEMFNKKLGSKVKECKLRVIYAEPSQPSSPIQEGFDGYLSSRSSVFSDQANALISKLTEERDNAIEQNKRLEQELELLKSKTCHRLSKGFDLEFQDLILRAKVFTFLETTLIEHFNSKRIQESAMAIADLVKFSKNVFVGEIPSIVEFLVSRDLCVCVAGLDCVLEDGHIGRREVVEATTEQKLVKILMDLRREGFDFDGCVSRFVIQLEVGEGLSSEEKSEVKLEMLRLVKEASRSDAEFATVSC